MHFVKSELEKLMHDEKLNVQQLAIKLSTSEKIIRKAQKKFNLQILNHKNQKVPRSISEEQKQLILASLISGTAILVEKDDRVSLKIVHPLKEKEYLDKKFDVLRDFVRTLPTVQVSKIGNKTGPCKSFCTLSHDYFEYLNIYIRDNGLINKKFLDQLYWFGLAIIYMDNGRKKHNCRDFCLVQYSKEEQQIFCDWLKERFQIEARVIRLKRGGEMCYVTRVLRQTLKRFLDNIRPFMVEKLKYKF